MMPPEKRIEAIERSLRCYFMGWISFVPVIGLGFAAAAVRLSMSVRAGCAGEWNPARRYARAGAILGGVGGLLSALEFGGLMVWIWSIGS
jgi:hypothetical protein